MHPAESRTFHATLEAWLGQLLLPAVFFALLTYTAVNAGGLNPWVGWSGLSALGLYAAVDYLLPMLRDWLHVDTRSMEGSFDGRYFHVYWSEVLAMWQFRRGGRRYLCLGARDRTYVIPLRFLDAAAVWESALRCAPPTVLAGDTAQARRSTQALPRRSRGTGARR